MLTDHLDAEGFPLVFHNVGYGPMEEDVLRAWTIVDAWRTSCPRLSIWEDAADMGLIAVDGPGKNAAVRLTESGQAALGAKTVV